MASEPRGRATVADLHRVEGKAELINGEILRLGPAGALPALAAMEIACRLRDHAEATGLGEAYTSTLAYVFPRLRSGRESFCPDASYHVGPFPENPMDFIPAAPTFAVEVRGLEDYAEGSETAMAAKRADYFEAGTLAVWDVDVLARTVAVYRADAPTTPAVYRRGDVAEAEPAVPGWRMAVSAIFGE
jgi:Uma2 family endonuclease